MAHVVRLVLLVLSLAAAAVPTGAAAAVHGPPAGKVFHSGLGGYDAGAVDEFARQSGKHPAVYQYFVSWKGDTRDLNFVARLLRQTEAAGSRTALAITTKDTDLSPRDIAAGRGDRFLIALNRMLAEHPSPTYLRPLSEMNNGANSYSAYDLRGRSRGPAYSTAQFRRAWRRTVVIVRGGEVADVNERLRAQGLPPTEAQSLARPAVSFQWVPLTFGNPEMARNHPRHWWPGSAYVDWVGTTWYSPYLTVSAFDRFYRNRLWRSKPFVFAEYGVWGAESPRFVRLFFDWVRTHGRVRMVSYYQSALLKAQFRLSTHPRSRAALRRELRSSRYLGR